MEYSDKSGRIETSLNGKTIYRELLHSMKYISMKLQESVRYFS